MTILLSEVVKHTRLRHPAFTRETIPTVALGQAMSDYQRELIKLAADRQSTLVVDRFSVGFDFEATDPVALLMTATAFGAVTGIPAFRDDTGDGIALDANDLPEVDDTVTLTVRYEDGLILPAHVKILGGTCQYSADGSSDSSDPSSSPVYLGHRFGREFHIVAYDQRFTPPVFPSGYILENKLYLCGQTSDWTGFVGIDVRYVPVTEDFTRESESFRLPDICREALYAKADHFAAQWAAARGKEVDLNQFKEDYAVAEAKVLAAVSDQQSRIVRTLKRNR